jgi:hypothetical protein
MLISTLRVPTFHNILKHLAHNLLFPHIFSWHLGTSHPKLSLCLGLQVLAALCLQIRHELVSWRRFELSFGCPDTIYA